MRRDYDIGGRDVKGFLTVLSIASLLIFTGCFNDNVKKGYSSLELGDYNMALEFFKEELKKNPKDFRARLGMGKALIQKASNTEDDTLSWRRALIHLEAARTLDPGREDIRELLGDAWYVNSRILVKRGDSLSALSALARAIEYNPDNTAALNQAGIIYFGLGEREKAVTILKKGIERDPDFADTYFNLGMVYWAQGEIKRASVLWKTALTLQPGDEDFLYWVARAEKRLMEDSNEQ